MDKTNSTYLSNELIIKYLKNSLSPEETEEVSRWLGEGRTNQDFLFGLEELYQVYRWDEMELAANTDERWNEIKRLISRQKKQKRFNASFILKYAAAVLLLAVSTVGTYFYTKNLNSEPALVELFTPDGEIKTVELPDGSRVQTNSGTLLLYPENFKGDTRTVYLVGEANFKVRKNPDKPFIVKSTTVSVTALGTEFNVNAYPENSEIVASLLEGKVRVDCGEEDKSYILHPGQQVIYQKHAQKSEISDVDLEDVIAWQKGICVFRGNTIEEIFAVLERRFNVTFQCNISSLCKDKYNFRFYQNSNLNEVLDIMKEVIGGLDYKVEKNVCYIKLLNDK